MQTIRWAVTGTGRIARVVVEELRHVEGAELVAVGSRRPESAQAFAQECGASRAHGSYAELMDDPEVDVVYVATPHPHHRDLALGAIRRGKAVLVEKAFTATYDGARQVVDAARAEGVFCMEAMWTRFLPAVVRAREVLVSGEIGEPRSVHVDFGAFREYDAQDRLFAPDLGGGALLDLGVYAVSAAQHVLGPVADLTARASTYETGVDADFSLVLTHEGGTTSLLGGGFNRHSPGRLVVAGSQGWLTLEPRFHHPDRLVVAPAGQEPREEVHPATGVGYVHQLQEVTTALREGRTESAVMPLDDTLEVMRVLSLACEQTGLHPREATVDC